MPLTFNIRHLERKDLHLEGELSAQDLELDGIDEMIRLTTPLTYDLNLERLSESILVQGSLEMTVDCECVRCLKPFKKEIQIENWACDLPLAGEERAQVENDCVDLTPLIREDILLAFPQHPLCHTECRGLLNTPQNQNQPAIGASKTDEVSSAWAELNKLKL
jgi:uncharacterized metal-binding protein YceD (DUF177 family)